MKAGLKMLVGASMLLGLAACGTNNVSIGGGSDIRKVTYELEGTASSADITIQTADGGTSQQTTSVPMRNTSGSAGLILRGFSAGDFVYISAQNNGSGTLTCRITSGHRIVSENTSSGQFAIVTCKGSA